MKTLHQPNDIIDHRYRIVTPLGQGGMGTTYEAEDLTDYKRVALKVLSLRQMGDWKVLELFEREAKVLANLDHPAIPHYLNYFQVDAQDDRRFYLVQELVSGQSFAELVEKGWKPDEAQVKQIATQVLEILHYLHTQIPPVIHRDIKPQNLIRHADGTVYLVDFGAVQDIYHHTVTRSGTFVGTLGYMPPEQFQGRVETPSDLYGLGATLLFLLVRSSPDRLPQRRMKLEFRDRISISTQFADWLEKMLEPLLEDRFASVEEALAALYGENSPPLVSTSEKPQSSPIEFYQTRHQLSLEIWPKPWGFTNLFWLVLTVILDLPTIVLSIFSFLACFIGFAINPPDFSTTLAMFMVLFIIGIVTWGIHCFFFNRLKAARGSHVRLNIDGETYQLKFQNCLGVKRKFQGKTSDLKQLVAIGSRLEMNDRPIITYLMLVAGQRKHKFHALLTPSEKSWLVSEVSYFIRQGRWGESQSGE